MLVPVIINRLKITHVFFQSARSCHWFRIRRTNEWETFAYKTNYTLAECCTDRLNIFQGKYWKIVNKCTKERIFCFLGTSKSLAKVQNSISCSPLVELIVVSQSIWAYLKFTCHLRQWVNFCSLALWQNTDRLKLLHGPSRPSKVVSNEAKGTWRFSIFVATENWFTIRIVTDFVLLTDRQRLKWK